MLYHVCGAFGYKPGRPRLRHYDGLNRLHFITASTYWRHRTHRNGRDGRANRRVGQGRARVSYPGLAHFWRGRVKAILGGIMNRFRR